MFSDCCLFCSALFFGGWGEGVVFLVYSVLQFLFVVGGLFVVLLFLFWGGYFVNLWTLLNSACTVYFCFICLFMFCSHDYCSGGRLKTIGENLRLPDDCVIGYIIGKIMV